MKTELFGFKAPSASCTDKKCPFHGEIQVKKELLKGVVVRKDINHSATISWFGSQYVPKYERFATKRSRLRVHNPACLDAPIGAQVVVARTRPLSKTKNHIIISLSEAKKMSKELLAETAAREHGKKKEEKDAENKDTTKDTSKDTTKDMKHKKSQEALHDESS